MLMFLLGIVMLVAGYCCYGKFVEKIRMLMNTATTSRSRKHMKIEKSP